MVRKKSKKPLGSPSEQRRKRSSASLQTRPDPHFEDNEQAQSSRGVSGEQEREALGPPASGTSISVFPIEDVGRENFPAKGSSRHTEKEDGLQFPPRERNIMPEAPLIFGRAFGPFKALLEDIYNASTSKEFPALKNKVELLLIHVDMLQEIFAIPPEHDVAEMHRQDKLIREIEGQLQFLSGRSGSQGLIDHAQDILQPLEEIQEAIFRHDKARQTAVDARRLKQMDPADARALSKVRCAGEAGYQHGHRGGCLKGTRGAILDEIELWAHDTYAPSVYWLNGLAGTGKTTIAQTIAERLFVSGRLGASFFCSRDFGDRSNLQLIFPTIAVQLARTHPQFLSSFVPLVRADREIIDESLDSQVNKLIVQPSVESAISTVIVIDALDECKDEESESTILSVLAQYVAEIPNVKFFITGRPAPHIQEGFGLPPLVEVTKRSDLHEVNPDEVNSDIRLFFGHHFSRIKHQYHVPDDWPTEYQLDQLCVRAAGLFVFAMATVKFVDQKNTNPKERLGCLLQSLVTASEGRAEFKPGSTLDSLYMVILQEAFGNNLEGDPTFRSVLGAVILATNPLTPASIATLLRLGIEDVYPRLSLMHSVLVLHDDTSPVRPFHKSFADFIVDPNRCTDPRFCIKPPDQHAKLLICCLGLMNQGLEHTMDYKKALEYSHWSWHKHLAGINLAQVPQITPILHQFLADKFLSWMRMFGAHDEEEVVDALDTVKKWLNAQVSPKLNLVNVLVDRNGCEGFGSLIVTISAIYVACNGSVVIRNKFKILLSQVILLEEHFDTKPHNVKEQHRRDNALSEITKIEGRMLSLCREQNLPQYGGCVSALDLLEDLQEATFTYKVTVQEIIHTHNLEGIDPATASLLTHCRRARMAEYRHGDRRRCLRRTCNTILDEVELWARDFRKPPIYWLNGLAGTGKSTIAQTIAERTFADGRLGASFFCSRASQDRSNLQFIFPTLAVQLARTYSEFRSSFIPLLQSDREVACKSLHEQMKKLIVQPLAESAISTVIVIDALDECEGEEPVSAILSVLGEFAMVIPKVKFFVTSRPEARVREGFRPPLLANVMDQFSLHEVEPAQANSDIRLFFKHKFTELRHRHPELNTSWPTQGQLDQLCARAAGSFLFATASFRFIDSQNRNPRVQLDRLLEYPESSAFEGKSRLTGHDTLDSFYMETLRRAFGNITSEDDPKIRSILGAVALSANPLSPSTIAALLGFDIQCILLLLSRVSSLIALRDIDHPVQLLHKSVSHFITDSTRCTDQRFCISPPNQHMVILDCCFRLMNGSLEKNMCKLSGGVANSEVVDLSQRTERHINKALEYACGSWHKHLTETTPDQRRKITWILRRFLEGKFLFWLEVLSVLGAASKAVSALEVTVTWLDGSSTVDLARDCLHFVTTFFGIISSSAQQIYTSALPQTPQTSLVYKLYKNHIR